MEEGLRLLFETSLYYQRQLLETQHVVEASKFYYACENGDIDTVKEMLCTISYDQLNQSEPNGSTPLHAATYAGHLEIVRLLIHQYNCQRHLRDRQGLTAYQVAQTDEMRKLYYRPSNENRFNDESNDIKQTFQMVSSLTNENENDDNVAKPDQRYLLGIETKEEIKRHLDVLNSIKALLQSRTGRYIMEQGMKLKIAKHTGYTKEEYGFVTSETFRRQALKKLLDEHVTPNHPDYQYCCYLLNEYIEQGTIESLLKLYTLETPFYRQLLIVSGPLGFPFFMHLQDLKQRSYQGYSYRGLLLSPNELNEYRWALKHKDSVLSLLPFTSTSIDRHVAEQFSEKSSLSVNKISALFIFHFPQPCDTAIYLSEIPQYQLPCISNYENEKEVLIAPRTFFKVMLVEIDRSNERCSIYLENICGKQRTAWKAVRHLLLDNFKKKTSELIHH